ncbi:ATP-binding cassette domain-containing protein [Siccirubricoccus sp. G192]|nr:ATP-binding cassette domain-containing protein [Siccirubricoccus sp. G192]
MSAPLLHAHNLGRRYGDYVALHGVTMEVWPGETVAIVGPNGAGKTTLVNLLTGLLVPSEGHVRFLGFDIAGAGPVKLARLGLARAFQLVQVFPELTVAETIAVGALAQLGRGRRMLASLGADRRIARPRRGHRGGLRPGRAAAPAGAGIAAGAEEAAGCRLRLRAATLGDPAGRADQRRRHRRQARHHAHLDGGRAPRRRAGHAAGGA